MKILTKRLITLFLLLVFVSTFIGCGPKPDVTVTNFFNAIKQGDLQKAAALVKSDEQSKDELKFDDPSQEKVVKSIFSKVDYTIGKSVVNGNNATIDVKVTSVDLTKVYAKMIPDLLGKYMTQAMSGEKVDEAKQNQEIMDYLVNAINDASAEKFSSDLQVKLVKDKKGWVIEPADDLFNAIIGNLEKMGGAGNSSKSSDSTGNGATDKSKK